MQVRPLVPKGCQVPGLRKSGRISEGCIELWPVLQYPRAEALPGGKVPAVLHAFLLDVVTTATHGQVSLGKSGGELLSGYGGNFIFLAADVRIS